MKKLLLGTVATLSVVTFQSANAQDSGLYAGVYGGYGWASAENSNGADPDPSGMDYGIYGGYKIDSMLDSAGLGLTGALEVHYGGSTADDRVGSVSMEKGREMGISFRPGISFMEGDSSAGLNPYGIIGYKISEFETSVPGLTADNDYHGFELGIGAELMSNGPLSARLDYSYTWYMEEDDIDIGESSLRLGLGYNF